MEDIYIEQGAMIKQGLTEGDLLLPVSELNKSGISTLMQKFDFVLND